MVTINLKSRFRNKAFIVAFISAIILLLQQIGLKQYIPENWMDVLNTVLTILMMLGAVVDTSTPGISDQSVSENSKNSSSDVSSSLIVQKSETTANLDTSASSKIVVDNPDNNVSIGATVNVTSAATPQ
jgi:uncharacterized membrane protein